MAAIHSETDTPSALREVGAFANANITMFCKVIDNLGDVGVAWRLARQLSDEAQASVSFVVDRFEPFAVIEPSLNPALGRQRIRGIEVHAWNQFAASDELRENATSVALVIEAFGAAPTQAYHECVSSRASRPVWINLEYLSAETWVDGVHGLPSPHPRLPLLRHFFCPGFSAGSGGLIREASLTRVDGRAASPQEARNLRVLAFTYSDAPLAWVARGLSSTLGAVTFFVPGERFENSPSGAALGSSVHRFESVPTVPQTEFDALLDTFDLLLVRGEDSFVRAQLAGKPMLWHIYPTEDRAHVVKLDAWLDRYCDGMAPVLERIIRRANHALIGEFAETDSVAAFADFARHLSELRLHAIQWQQRLFAEDDLLTRLARFYVEKRST